MKKILLYIFAGFVALSIILFVALAIFTSNFDMFDVEKTFLDSIHLSNCNQANVSVVSVPSNVTLEGSIQVFYSIKSRDSTILIEYYKRFNKLKGIEKIGDCAIEIMVEDTIREIILTDTLKIDLSHPN